MNKRWINQYWNVQSGFFNKSQKNFLNFDENVLSTNKSIHKLLNSSYLIAERKNKQEKPERNLNVKLLPRDCKLRMKAIIILNCEVFIF